MNYDGMSDFEINKLVFPHTRDYGKCEDVMAQKNPGRGALMWGDGVNWFQFDACNNPADMWPIIVENKISVHKYFYSDELEWSDNWEASFDKHVNIREGNPEGDLIFHRCENPLRSAAILFLKIQDYL